jgi:hypothetical protein
MKQKRRDVTQRKAAGRNENVYIDIENTRLQEIK